MKKMYKTNLIGWLMIAACLMGITHGYALTPSLSYSQDTISRTIQSFSYGFNTDLDGWTLIDNDGDGHCWYHSSEGGNHNSGVDTISGHVRGESFCNVLNAALTPDDYLVSPQRYGIVNGSTISFWARAQDANYPLEHFGVAISTSPSGNFNATSFTTIQEWTLTAKRGRGTDVGRDGRQINDSGTWYQYTCNLSAYSGQKVWIAIRHFNCTDQFIIGIDNIMINNVDTWFFEQGFVTDPGVMTNGGDASWTKGSQTTWGPNANHNIGYMLADEFTINAQTNINEITVYAYQTGSSTTSTFTGLYAQIFNGSPMNGGTIVWGNNTNNIMTTTAFTNCYRGSDGETGATTRPIMSITASGLNIQLTAGTYYLVYSLTGSGSSGPYGAPQCEPGIGNTGNGLQYTNNSWTNLIDTGSNTTYGCSMKLNGTQTGATNYTITVSASPTNGGAPYIGNNPGSTQATFTSGQSCTVHANPANGYSFTNWTENGTVVSTYANYTFNVNSNRNLVAHFQAQSQNYTISVSASPTNGGNPYIGSTPGTTQATYASGQSCTVHANPTNGYTFVRWTENGTQVSTNANYTFTVTSNRNLVAQFTQQQYHITVSANPTNGGSVTGSGYYYYGTVCTLHATPSNGYTFEKWTLNGTQVSTSPDYSFTVIGDAAYVAHFQQSANNYTINVFANPTAGGIVSGGGTYQQGQQCTVAATANDGYDFINWTEDGEVVSENNNYTFSVSNNRILVANFQIQSFNITVTIDPIEGGTVIGEGTYNYGDRCTLIATPNNGYAFNCWMENGTIVSTNPVLSFIVTGNVPYVAHFVQSTNDFTITASANPVNGGTVTGGGNYSYGESCTLTALPNDGFTFVNWVKNGNVVSEEPFLTFTVTENATYIANFAQNTNGYTITASANPISGGTITGTGTYVLGLTCTLTATANEGYKFVNWTENGVIQWMADQYEFVVDHDRTLVANFEALPTYTISAMAGANGTITPQGDVIVVKGADQTFIMAPDLGGSILKVMVDGIDIGPVDSYTFTNVNRNHTIYVSFSGMGIEETQNLNVNIYPNPAKDIVFIEGEEIETVALYDLTGNCLRIMDYNTCKEMNVSGLSKGIYVLMLTTNDGHIGYQKLVLN
jgi:hypothetical protein